MGKTTKVTHGQTFTTRRAVVVETFIFLTSVFFTFGAYFTLLYLQSSINIEKGLGVASATAAYLTSTFSNLIITPLLLKRCGATKTIAFGQFTYFLYICANFYPEYFTLIPAGMLAGIGEGSLWPGLSLYVTHLSFHFARFRTNGGAEAYRDIFAGYLFFASEISRCCGNLVSFAIFHAGKQNLNEQSNSSTQNPLQGNPFQKHNGTASSEFDHCGVNDCQDPDVINTSSEQYEPSSPTVFYIVIGCMAGFEIVSSLIILFGTRNPEEGGRSVKIQDAITSDAWDTSSEAPLRVKAKRQPDSRIPKENQIISAILTPDIRQKELSHTFCFDVRQSLISTLRQMVSPKQLLITPITFYTGMQSAFIVSEMTRAYASCLLGVEQVSLASAISTASSAAGAYVSSKVCSRFGRNIPVASGFLIDSAFYICCLLWKRSTFQTMNVVYALFVARGALDGTWKLIANVTHALYFPKRQSTAFAVWNLWFVFGFAMTFAVSTSLCVSTKIYIQILLLCFSTLCYGFAERIDRREKTVVSKRKRKNLT